MNYNKRLIDRVATRFLEASRSNRTNYLLAVNIHGSDVEVTAKNFEGLYDQLTDVIHEAHSYGNGAFDFQFTRGSVDYEGEIDMGYKWVDGSNRGRSDSIGLTLYAENKRERTIELAKPKDISNFKKYIQGQYFGDTPYFYGDRVR